MLWKTSESTLLRSWRRARTRTEREMDRGAAWIVAHFYEFFDLLRLEWIDVYFNTLSKQDEKTERYILSLCNDKEHEQFTIVACEMCV